MNNIESSIPENAAELVDSVDTCGYQTFVCILDNKVVGIRLRNPNGIIEREFGLANGRKHGIFREWSPSGKLIFETNYIQGKEHGIAKQWDEDRKLLGTYKMHDGSGVSLWFGINGELSEELHYLNGMRHGVERWWDADNKTIYIERYWKEEKLHGIEREWNQKGKLRRGYPKFFISGRIVNKQKYRNACKKDSSLVLFKVEDNDPQRKLPKQKE
ncbi:MAG: toxin-antitoxin system YwqK family antitoxin [Planctomycetota bacterium]|jgi:antitoxin component YwqK of YwqJK toxin-antitoxin module